MKKHYVKPAGAVVAMNLNENIATSGFSTTNDTYAVQYTYNADRTEKYLMNSTIPATATTNEAFNLFYDLLKCNYYKECANCSYDPE